MKLLLLFLLVGAAYAYTETSAVDDAAERLVHGLFLQEAEEEVFSQYAEDDVISDIGKKLREMLDRIMEKIKEDIEKGKEVKKELLDKLKEVREKMRQLRLDYGEKAKEMLQKIREHVRKVLNDLLDGLIGSKKSSSDEFELVEQLAESRLRDMFNKLKDWLREKIDKDKLKEKIEEIFGKGSRLADSLLEIIQTKGDKYKEKLLELIDKYLDKKEIEKRSIKEWWEKIKDYFKDLHIDLKEKYAKFGEWVKERFEKTKELGKSKIENIKEIAKELIDHTKGLSKDVAAEGLEFLRPYKEDLGALWDQVKDSVKEILNRKD